MRKLSLSSEVVHAHGNVMAPGVLNQLGRPDMNGLTVLAREAVQNSWDARKTNKSTVLFGADAKLLDQNQRNFLWRKVFSDIPDNLPLAEYLTQQDIYVLTIYDRGTTGLGGPTRADAPYKRGEYRDFVDFVRNVGQPPDKVLAGGTYGYGKAAFFRSSNARTICIHTRCRYKGKLESRFIASALGKPFHTPQDNFTGRHWWGKLQNKLIEPLLGDEANEFAQNLGMPEFSKNATGTSILIISPFDQLEESPWHAMNHFAETLLWNFWPKLVSPERKKPMKFSVTCDGKKIKIPSPETYPPLEGFIGAYKELKGFQDASSKFRNLVESVDSQRPKQHLGVLSLQQYLFSKTSAFELRETQSEYLEMTHHVALMRQPELVVKYLPGNTFANPNVAYGGVFIADKEVDAVFAESEPPTHDDWVEETFPKGRKKAYIRRVYQRIAEYSSQFVNPELGSSIVDTELLPLGAFASEIGRLLPLDNNPIYPNATSKPASPVMTPPSQKPVIEPTPHLGNGTPLANPTPAFTISKTQNEHISSPFDIEVAEKMGRARVHIIGESELIEYVNKPAVRIQFLLEHGDNSHGSLVTAHPQIVLEDGRIENDPPTGGELPQVLLWESSAEKFSGDSSIFIPLQMSTPWYVIVSIPSDSFIRVDLRAEAKRLIDE